MSKNCAECTYLSEENRGYGYYYCDKKHEEHYATDPECGSFCCAYSRADSTIRNMIDYSKSYQSSSGCYITTMLCDVLGLPDDNESMMILRLFRDSYMRNGVKNMLLLQTYDTIGPQIAYNISIDKNKEEISKRFFTEYIIPAVESIKRGNYENAKNIYKSMTYVLADHYHIPFVVDTELDYNNIHNLGHARIRVVSEKKAISK